MSLKNSTFLDLKNLTFALIGREYASDTAQFARLVALWNQGAKRAYRASNYWDRHLVVGEPRSAASGVVESAEESFFVTGAGIPEANGLYVLVGTYDNANAYSLTTGSTTYSLRNQNANDWEIVQGEYDDENATVLYTHGGSSGDAPDPHGWSTGANGIAPAPSVLSLGNIDTFLRIYKQEPFKGSAVKECDFHVSKGRARVLGTSSNRDTVYVTYKEEYTPEYATNSADDDVVPDEYMNYMAHYAAYTWQRSVEQNASENNFALSLGLVNQILEDELAKIEGQGIFNSNVARKFKTYRNYY